MLTFPQTVPRLSIRRVVLVLAVSVGGVVGGGLASFALLQGVFCALVHFDRLGGVALCPLPLPIEFPTELYLELFHGR